MRGVALVIGALGLGLGLWYGEPLSVVLDTTYQLAASRWQLGQFPHVSVESPAEWVGLWFYRLSPEAGAVFFRIWRALGLIGLAGFFWRYRSRERPPHAVEWLLFGASLGLWGLVPYRRPGEVGFPLYVWGLWLGEGTSWAFGRGVLLGLMTGWHPAAAVALGWWAVYRLEQKEPFFLLRQVMGWLWGLLTFFAVFKLFLGEGVERYFTISQLGAWRYGEGDWRWQLSAVSLVLTLLASWQALYVPYQERRLYRARLWAALAAGLLPALWLSPLGLWVFLWEGAPLPAYRFLRRLMGVLTLGLLGWLVWDSRPKCYVEIAPHSCLWGTLPCYLRLQGPYGCDFTSPYHFPPSLEQAYDWLKSPAFLYDYEGTFALLRLKMPLKLAPYQAVDTLLPGLGRLYIRGPNAGADHSLQSGSP